MYKKVLMKLKLINICFSLSPLVCAKLVWCDKSKAGAPACSRQKSDDVIRIRTIVFKLKSIFKKKKMMAFIFFINSPILFISLHINYEYFGATHKFVFEYNLNFLIFFFELFAVKTVPYYHYN